MNDKPHIRDLHTFREGDTVDIDGIPEMTGLKIERISDSGVTVSGGNLFDHTVLSGRSPAKKHIKTEKPVEIKPISTPSVGRSKPKEIVLIKAPDKRPFTIREVAEFNNVFPILAQVWIKDNCEKVGQAEKKPGQRGKLAALYNVKA